MVLRDPDSIINWHRTEEPGEYPTWESKAGVIKQMTFGDNASFDCLLTATATKPLTVQTTIANAKRTLETHYWQNNAIPDEAYEPITR